MHEDAHLLFDSNHSARADALYSEAAPVTSISAHAVVPRPVPRLVWDRDAAVSFASAPQTGFRDSSETDCISLVDKVVGSRIRHRRDELRLTRAELAVKVELSIEQLARFEAGSERLGAATFLRISRSLGVRPAYLFDIEGRSSQG